VSERIWFCKIGGPVDHLPDGSDWPMRRAIQRAFEEVTGSEHAFTFSGWGGSLTEGERAVVENRRPASPTAPAIDVDSIVREVADAMSRVPFTVAQMAFVSSAIQRAALGGKE